MVYVDDSGYRADDPKRIPDQSFTPSFRPDPRPPKRQRASQTQWADLRQAKSPRECRLCGTKTGLSLHHLLPRSLGGSDVLENLCWLCGTGTTGHHGAIEARDPWACSLLGQRLTDAEYGYLLAHKGEDFIHRYYGVRAA